jgi:D-lactate dehydrogenase
MSNVIIKYVHTFRKKDHIMNNIKIAFFDTKPYDKESFEAINKKYNYEVTYFKEHLTKDTAPLTKDHNVVCVFVNDIIDKELIDILVENSVQLIALRCAGYNNVELKAVYKKINVVRVPAYSPYAVAEHAMALVLALNRKIHKAYFRTRDSNFTINGLQGFDLHGKTAGVIGTGKIGKVMIDILKGFGMNILAYDYYPDEAYAKQVGYTYTGLDTLYRDSNLITLHCPLTKETYHMINETSIQQMKDGVMLINTSRGQLIDSTALLGGLKNKKIGAAGLDVYEEEAEYFFEDFSGSHIEDDVLARLLTFNNVLITSHQAFFTREALESIAKTTMENIRAFFADAPLENEICYKCTEGACPKGSNKRCF